MTEEINEVQANVVMTEEMNEVQANVKIPERALCFAFVSIC